LVLHAGNPVAAFETKKDVKAWLKKQRAKGKLLHFVLVYKLPQRHILDDL
jgi:hypothetical protein